MNPTTAAGMADQRTRDLAEIQRLREQVAELTGEVERLRAERRGYGIPTQGWGN